MRNDLAWMRFTLVAAAIYNIAFGTWVVLRPNDLFVWSGADLPLYPSIWQCVGMIVGVYGVGFAIAASDPLRHWPIVLVALLGKVLGPLGFAYQFLITSSDTPGHLPLSWAWVLLTNDFVWWIPFGCILYFAFKTHSEPESGSTVLSVSKANELFRSQRGRSISELSSAGTVQVIFLRHAGCTFCRETLADLSEKLRFLCEQNVTPVIVHMSDDEHSANFFAQYGLGEVDRISDPHCQLYRAYGLSRGTANELLGPAVWWPGFRAAILNRHGVGKLDGDGFQLGGSFLVRNDQILEAQRHRTSAGRVDFSQVCTTSVAHSS